MAINKSKWAIDLYKEVSICNEDLEISGLNISKLTEMAQSAFDRHNQRHPETPATNLDDIQFNIFSEPDTSCVTCYMTIKIPKTQEEVDYEIAELNKQSDAAKEREFQQFLKLKEKFEKNKNS